MKIGSASINKHHHNKSRLTAQLQCLLKSLSILFCSLEEIRRLLREQINRMQFVSSSAISRICDSFTVVLQKIVGLNHACLQAGSKGTWSVVSGSLKKRWADVCLSTPPRKLCFSPGSICLLDCQQYCTKTTKEISPKWRWRMGLSPEKTLLKFCADYYFFPLISDKARILTKQKSVVIKSLMSLSTIWHAGVFNSDFDIYPN